MTDPSIDPEDLARGLEPGHRFRCRTCGNLTRFDVVATEQTRRFHHFELGGERHVEEEEVLSRTIHSVNCRWCGNEDIAVESVSGVDPDSPLGD